MNAVARTSLPLALCGVVTVLITTTQFVRAQAQDLPDARRAAMVAATATATVKAVDPSNRTVTLETPDGDTTVVRCGPDVVNFDQIAVGDRVRATVLGQMVVGLAKPGTASAGAERSIVRAPKGAKPGVMITDTVSLTAKVDSVDPLARTVTVAGDGGKLQTFKVAPDVDLAGVNAGDDVVVKFTRGLALMVEKPDADAQLSSGTDKPERGAAVIETRTASATVESIDKDKRLVTLKGADGDTRSIHLGPECINFDQIKVGDRVTATLAEEHVIGVGKAASSPGPDAGAATMIARAPEGSKPRVLVTDVAEITARIDAIDRANRTVTLTGPKGKSRTMKVGPAVNLEALKSGDEVVLRCTQALAIAVETP
jgi:hypothetical protein